MQREIKFRIFDKKLRVWLGPDTIGINLNGVPIAPDGTWLKHNLADLVITQFTGLHDRHGKEIWEGDRVKASIYSDEEQILEVKYEYGAFLIDFGDSEVDFHFVGCFPGSLEVIGHIFEEGK